MRKKKAPNREEVKGRFWLKQFVWDGLAWAVKRKLIRRSIFWCLLGLGLCILIGYFLPDLWV